MNNHLLHDSRYVAIGAFQGHANAAAGLPAVNGRDLAMPEQLAAVEDWMLTRIREHCDTHRCPLPSSA